MIFYLKTASFFSAVICFSHVVFHYSLNVKLLFEITQYLQLFYFNFGVKGHSLFRFHIIMHCHLFNCFIQSVLYIFTIYSINIICEIHKHNHFKRKWPWHCIFVGSQNCILVIEVGQIISGDYDTYDNLIFNVKFPLKMVRASSQCCCMQHPVLPVGGTV